MANDIKIYVEITGRTTKAIEVNVYQIRFNDAGQHLLMRIHENLFLPNSQINEVPTRTNHALVDVPFWLAKKKDLLNESVNPGMANLLIEADKAIESELRREKVLEMSGRPNKKRETLGGVRF